MADAIDNTWPQDNANGCGVENAIALVNYDDVNNGQNLTFNSLSSQDSLEAANQTSGQSQWGHATPTNHWGGITNIAPDYGTDPRSIAYMTWNYSLNNRFFHDYIYRWQFYYNPRSPAPPFALQVQEATTGVARALEEWGEPVSVTINGGLHSVVVGGIWSGNDPATNYPADIQGLVYRDPEGGASIDRVELNYSYWLSGYKTVFGVYSLWSLYYGDVSTPGDGQNFKDPEPTVGPYIPDSFYQAHPEHWYDGFTWIQRDDNYSNGQYSPDWSYTSPGNQQMFNS